ncbi:MAG TPA: IclR family transcriptional regulator [Chloroflexota bacterium]|nr:IclR family transcriptional regulator [Chloroflexota bacterium]
MRAVERAVTLLFILAEQQRLARSAHFSALPGRPGRPTTNVGGQSLNELGRELGCSKSTVHRLLATLERLEVVERDSSSRRYRLGQRVQELARDSWPARDLRQLALPVMEQLRDACEETVTLHLLDGADHVVIDQYESRQEIRRSLPLGQRIPLLRGATAKAILAFLPNEQTRAILAQTRTPEHEGPTVDELADIRRLGFTSSAAERVPGGSAISAPIQDRSGRVCAALSISGPSFRFTAARATRWGPELVRAARRVSAGLGYDGQAEGGSDGDRGF